MLTDAQRKEVRYLLDLSSDLQIGRVLTSAVVREVFARFEGTAMSVEELARSSEDPEAVARWTRLLASADLLKGEDGRYRLSDLAERYLTSRGLLDVRPMLRLHHRIYDAWGGFEDALLGGRTDALDTRAGGGAGATNVPASDDAFSDALFAEAMEVRAALAAEAVARELEPLLRDARFLDLGAGSGGFGRAFVRTAGASEGVLIELPGAVEVARRFVRADEMRGRLEVRAADLRDEEEFGSGFDLVFASALLRLFGPETNRRIVQRSYRALRPGGRLVIFDYFPEEEPWPVDAALFHLSMWLFTEEGAIYPERRHRSWLREAGFDRIEREDFAEDGTLLLARRPAGPGRTGAL